MSSGGPGAHGPGTDIPEPNRRWLGLGVLALGVSMIVIDGTIVGVSLPVIIADLDLDLTDAQWVNSLYSIVFASLLLTAGRIGDRAGRRGLFMVGTLVFVVGSVLAAQASSAPNLLIARTVQGIGGAFVLPTALSTVNATFRGNDRAAAFGVWGAVIAGAAALGPLLGGWFTTSFTWPWIFLVNIPIGLVVLVGAFLAVPSTKGDIKKPGIDVDGFQLSVLGFGLTVFAIIEGPVLGWWHPIADFTVFGWTWSTDAAISIVPISLALGLMFIALFIVWERHRARVGRSAILDVSLLRIPSFRWGNLTAAMVAVGEFGLIFALPLYIVNVLGLSTFEAGLVFTAMALGAFVSGGMARKAAAALGVGRVVVLGLTLEIVGVLAVAFLVSPTTSPWTVGGWLTLYGLGLGLAAAQLTSITLSEVPPEKSGQGSATQSTVRQLGSALGVAAVGAALSLGLAANLDLSSAGLPPAMADRIEDATRQSAGGVIPGLAEQGSDSRLGDATDAVVANLRKGFTDATSMAVFVAAGFLALGLLGSLRVAKAYRGPKGTAAAKSG